MGTILWWWWEMNGKRRREKPVPEEHLRPLTDDSVNTFLFFARRGYSLQEIAREVNRAEDVVRDALIEALGVSR